MEINEKWLVGFLEGDGYFSLDRGKYPRMYLCQKDTEALTAVKNKFGGKIYGENVKKLIIPTAEAKRIMMFYGHLLSDRRRAQAREKGFIVPDLRLEHDLEWFAGFYEAEGSTYLVGNGKTQKKYVRMSITQYYSPQTSEFCQLATGRGRLAGPHMAYDKLCRYAFEANGEVALSILDDISNSLSKIKLTQRDKARLEWPLTSKDK